MLQFPISNIYFLFHKFLRLPVLAQPRCWSCSWFCGRILRRTVSPGGRSATTHIAQSDCSCHLEEFEGRRTSLEKINWSNLKDFFGTSLDIFHWSKCGNSCYKFIGSWEQTRQSVRRVAVHFWKEMVARDLWWNWTEMWALKFQSLSAFDWGSVEFIETPSFCTAGQA